MKFYKKLTRVFDDLPYHTTLLIHSLVGCPMKCVGCHNYDEIIANTPKDYYTDDDIISHIEQNGFLFDAVMFSGGEFLLEGIDKISNLLLDVREIFEGKIIVNTNGMFPDKIDFLLRNSLVDGIHVDMKLPYHLLDVKEDKDIYRAIMGINPTKQIVDDLLNSIELVIKSDTTLSQVRTVKYPMLSDEFFKETELYVNELKTKYNSNVPYFQNEFMDVNN